MNHDDTDGRDEYALRRPKVEPQVTTVAPDAPEDAPDAPEDAPDAPTIAAMCVTCGEVRLRNEFVSDDECILCNTARLKGIVTQPTGQPGDLMNRFDGDTRRYASTKRILHALSRR